MKPRLIVIDGKTYNSVSEMPADVRRQYEQAMSSFKDQDRNQIPDALEDPGILSDKNRDGIPDIMQAAPGAPIIANALKVLFDGREFNSIDELPPDARAKYEAAMATMDANRNGIPDFVEGMITGTVQQPQPPAPVSTTFTADTTRHASRQPMPVHSTIEPDTPNVWLLALLAVVLFLVCVVVAAGVWYFYLR